MMYDYRNSQNGSLDTSYEGSYTITLSEIIKTPLTDFIIPLGLLD